MKRRLGWLIMGLGVRVLELGSSIIDLGARLAASLLARIACALLDWSCRLDPPPIAPGLVDRIARRMLENRPRVETYHHPGPVNWRDHV